MAWWQILVFPFSIPIELLTRFRNYLYNSGFLKSFEFETNLIAIGNLSMGGSGKTPLTIYLIEFLRSQGLRVSTLSRGYRRKSRGFLIADGLLNATQLGDEPFQYVLRFGDEIGVAVGEDRVLSIPDLLYSKPETQIILLDDAFQQRALKVSLSVLLTRYDQPFWTDFVVPAGSLREKRAEAGRANVIVVTGCPKTLSESDRIKLKSKANAYSEAPVFFTWTEFLEPVPFFGSEMRSKVLGISGIAHPKPFEDYLIRNYQVKLTYRFPDHHPYSEVDIQGIIKELDADTTLIVTEKDYVKLREFHQLSEYSCFYLPIRTRFLKDEALFQSIILHSVKVYPQNTN